MIWLYDNAIADDLRKSINPEGGLNDIVKVIDPSQIPALLAQIKGDEIKLPIVCLQRHPDTPIDSQRYNFTRLHRGVQCVYDEDSHNMYYEKMLPIKLEYDLSVLTTNVVDTDELVKEILFKYTNEYFIRLTLPYEGNRTFRFGVVIDPDVQITRKSSTDEYIKNGTLYETVVPLRIDGAVLVSYTPAHIARQVLSSDVKVIGPTENL